ncbi:MAG: division plane positioning ATPase MipZ [Alphaproteobacteria bacterium]|nr:division plane positioning ATPase MipZ [Alphaproteobacteria bacterium]
MNEPATGAPATPVLQQAKKAHVIVIGNEKGGCGKTTTAMHLIVALLRMGFSVGSIDIDSRQRSLSRYLENRKQTALKEDVPLPSPQHVVVQKSPFNIVQEAEADEHERFIKALGRIQAANDFIVIDSPGSDTYLARVAHAYANTVITPINDSFVDLDVLANVDGQTMKIIKPSIYSEMMWEQKLQRAKRDGGSIEWIVMRNRLSNIDAKNKRFMTQVTGDLSRRIGFRVAPGFSERVIFREMFLQGLTVLDIMETKGATISMSHIAARQEVRDLLRTLKIPAIEERLTKSGRDDGEQEEKHEAASPSAAEMNAVESKNEPAEVKQQADLPTTHVATEPAAAIQPAAETDNHQHKVVTMPPAAPVIVASPRPMVELAS